MTVLALRLAGPMQSWGAESRFSNRDTQGAPTKSGVLGLLAAARGLRRTDPIEDLLTLRFGVRKDQPGELMRDFHTAHRLDGRSMPLSYRYYLSDAVFVVGLEGDSDLLESLNAALREPTFPLYLGRRSCPPAGEVTMGLRQGATLESFFVAEEWAAARWWRRRHLRGNEKVELEVLLDGVVGSKPDPEVRSRPAFTVRDVPESWDPVRRLYGWRTVYRMWVTPPVPADVGCDDGGRRPASPGTPEHLPMASFGG